MTNDSRWATALAALDANLLVALDALLQEQSVTRAARRLGVTQPAMSQTLGRLRRQFDDPILVRVGRRMEPTPFALRIRARLQRAISDLEAVVRDRPAYDPASASNRVVIACVDYLALVLVPPLQRLLAEEAPGVQLAVHALEAGSISERLAQGIVHLYLGIAGDTERALVAQPLYREPLQVLVAAHHPLAGGLTAEAYAAARHVHVSPRREVGSVVGRALAELGHHHHVAVEVPFFALVPSLLAHGDLVATLPATIAHQFARDPDLVVQDAPLELPPLHISAAWHPSFEADPAQRWLREAVVRVASNLVSRSWHSS